MTVVSLFSGCGGMDLGFQRAGFDIIYSNDFDKYAVESYRHNIGDHIELADISEVNEQDIPPHDLLIGGFPCQPFSMMGAQQGFLDNLRGTLFFDIARIIEAHMPRVVVLENVKNLRTHDSGRTIQVITDTLTNLGYKVRYEVLNSLNYGVPQTRNRLFIVCIRDDVEEALRLNNIVYQFPVPTILDLNEINLQSVLETDVDPKYYLSHRILPTILAHGTGNYYSRSVIDLAIARPLTATMAKMHRANQDNYVTDPSPRAEAAGKTNIRRLTPRECARLQGFPEDYEIVVSDSQAYKQFGNAVTINVIESLAHSLLNILPDLVRRR